jgi:hypothetical protein
MHLNVTFSFQDMITNMKRYEVRDILKSLGKWQHGFLCDIKGAKNAIRDLHLRAQQELLGPYMAAGCACFKSNSTWSVISLRK